MQISLTYNINSTGPRTLPWGTPLITGRTDEYELISLYCLLKKLCFNRTTYREPCAHDCQAVAMPDFIALDMLLLKHVKYDSKALYIKICLDRD